LESLDALEAAAQPLSHEDDGVPIYLSWIKDSGEIKDETTVGYGPKSTAFLTKLMADHKAAAGPKNDAAMVAERQRQLDVAQEELAARAIQEE